MSQSSSSLMYRSKMTPNIHYRFTRTTGSTTTTDDRCHINHKNNNNCNPSVVQPHQCHRSVEIWTTTCIATNFGRDHVQLQNLHHHHHHHPQFQKELQQLQRQLQQLNHKWVLINPCNSGLTGCTLFPYFPRGGPVPPHKVLSTIHRDWQPLGYVSQWGGMDVGNGMLYPSSVVDGLVHIYGGSKLQTELYWLRQMKKKQQSHHFWNTWWWWWSHNNDTQLRRINDHQDDEPCPIGQAVVTSAGNGSLAERYDHIIHTSPPFFQYNTHPTLSVETLLSDCYTNALRTIIEEDMYNQPSNSDTTTTTTTTTTIAMPLLGAGARGFPIDVACRIAAQSIVQWLSSSLDDDDPQQPIIPTIQRYDLCNSTTKLDHPTTTTMNSNGIIPHNKDQQESTTTTTTTTTTNVHSQRRIAFGLLDVTVAQQLAEQITMQIELHNDRRS